MFTKEILLVFHKFFTTVKNTANGGVLIVERCLEKGPENMDKMDRRDILQYVVSLSTHMQQISNYLIESALKK